MSIDEWLHKGLYLPPFMRDFHDQKRVFKRIDEIVWNDKQNPQSAHRHEEMPNWILAHIYVVDFFLWFMARRGYTLQRSRMRLPFVSMEDDLKDYDRRDLELLRKELDAMATTVNSQ